MRTFHYFITHLFLPRNNGLHIVTKLDLWVLSNAITGRKIDYSQLLFGSIVRSVDAHLGGRLPYGGFITLLLSNLGISLDGYSTVETSISIPALTVLKFIGVNPQTSKGGGTLELVARKAKPISKFVSKSMKLGESSTSVCKNLIISFEEEEAELEPEFMSEKDIRLFAEDLERDLMEGVAGTYEETQDNNHQNAETQGESKGNYH
ncbi:unnamed protein product [Linum trigynum]|uniref:Uncharacterized protein n=1 Tax=Linum trigynum TaxID=586398 RepID=A0AAV2CV26_9ROSI